MLKQLTLDFDDDNGSSAGGFMLWYEKNKATPEQAIKNAERYFCQKYERQPHRVVLPLIWKGHGENSIETEPLEESLGLIVETDKTILPKHVAVYLCD